MTIPLQFASLYDGQEVFVWSDHGLQRRFFGNSKVGITANRGRPNVAGLAGGQHQQISAMLCIAPVISQSLPPVRCRHTVKPNPSPSLLIPTGDQVTRIAVWRRINRLKALAEKLVVAVTVQDGPQLTQRRRSQPFQVALFLRLHL